MPFLLYFWVWTLQIGSRPGLGLGLMRRGCTESLLPGASPARSLSCRPEERPAPCFPSRESQSCEPVTDVPPDGEGEPSYALPVPLVAELTPPHQNLRGLLSQFVIQRRNGFHLHPAARPCGCTEGSGAEQGQTLGGCPVPLTVRSRDCPST